VDEDGVVLSRWQIIIVVLDQEIGYWMAGRDTRHGMMLPLWISFNFRSQYTSIFNKRSLSKTLLSVKGIFSLRTTHITLTSHCTLSHKSHANSANDWSAIIKSCGRIGSNQARDRLVRCVIIRRKKFYKSIQLYV
jgi:hypothetical protein